MANFYRKSHQLGRSMIEMLGVLAIIGVLSIASISAYSRAMFKYQLNKHAEDFNLLLQNAISFLPNLQREYGNGENNGVALDSLFASTSLLPDSMHYNENGKYIYDIFKKRFTIRYMLYETSNYAAPEYLIHYQLQRSGNKVSPRDKEICRNFMLVSKESFANIFKITLSGGASGEATVYGDLVTERNKKLRNMGPAEIDKFCDSCDSPTGCLLRIYIGHWANIKS